MAEEVTYLFSEKEVANILQNRKMLIASLRNRRELICRECSTKEGQIHDIVLQSRRLVDDPIAPTNDNKDKMLQILEEQQRRFREEQQALEDELTSLAEQEYRINKVWTAFRCLPPADFYLLNELYVRHNKWEAVAEEQGISKSSITRARRQAMKKLMHLIAMPTDEISRLVAMAGKFKDGDGAAGSGRRGRRKDLDGQLSFEDIFKRNNDTAAISEETKGKGGRQA